MNEKKKSGNLIELAIEVAVKAHQNQVRKGTDIPYITHPLAVGIILARAGCSRGHLRYPGRHSRYIWEKRVYDREGSLGTG